jgi:hypothetical protein
MESVKTYRFKFTIAGADDDTEHVEDFTGATLQDAKRKLWVAHPKAIIISAGLKRDDG